MRPDRTAALAGSESRRDRDARSEREQPSAAMLGNWRSTAALAVILICTLLPVAQAQPSPPPGMRGGAGGMATRGVSNYLTRERTLQDALERRDRAAVTVVLAADLEQWSAFVPDIASADDWLRSEFASKQP